jgi:hypothetical protein
MRLLIFESHGDSNRCIPCRGKPNTHDTYASHASPRALLVRFLWPVPVRGNLSLAINSVGRTLLLPRKGAPDAIPSMSAEPSVGPPPSFSLNTTIEAVMKAKHLLKNGYNGLLGPLHQHVICMFNTFSREATHRSLTDTCGGYNLRGANLPHHTP